MFSYGISFQAVWQSWIKRAKVYGGWCKVDSLPPMISDTCVMGITSRERGGHGLTLTLTS